MGPKPNEAPAFFSLLVFLGFNYLIGYCVAHLITGSIGWSVLLALMTPCFSLVIVALVARRGMDFELNETSACP